MTEAVLFAEDFGHEEFLTALTRRLAAEAGVQLSIRSRSVRGGRGKALTELAQYLSDLGKGRDSWPDLLIVTTDANCEGLSQRRRSVERTASQFEQSHPGRLVVAIPDPHVERWMLIDSHAFKAVFGRGCNAPDRKCERQRYKMILIQEIQAAGVTPLLGGMEYAGDIVDHLDLDRTRSLDESLGQTIATLRQCLKALAPTGQN